MACSFSYVLFFFFNDTATTEIYTLSLHDALPIFILTVPIIFPLVTQLGFDPVWLDRKSTRLNSSHTVISYAVFCLKKKKNTNNMWLIKVNYKKNIINISIHIFV